MSHYLCDSLVSFSFLNCKHFKVRVFCLVLFSVMWEDSRVLCFPSRRGLTSGESGMQPGDPCCPWRGTLCPGQKPRWGLFCPTVTREQHPSLPRNSNGRLVFTGPTQEEVWISRCNSRIPPQLLKTTWFPIHRNMKPLPATESQEKSHVSS